jgi:hypothetical protein
MLLDSGLKNLDSRIWTQESGLKNLDSRIWTQESGLWTLGPKRGVTKFWRLFSSVQISDGLS